MSIFKSIGNVMNTLDMCVDNIKAEKQTKQALNAQINNDPVIQQAISKKEEELLKYNNKIKELQAQIDALKLERHNVISRCDANIRQLKAAKLHEIEYYNNPEKINNNNYSF